MNWKEPLHSIYMKTVLQPLTVVESSRILNEMKEDRKFSIVSSYAESKRAQAKVVGAVRSLDDPQDLQEFHLRSESYLIETRARSMLAQSCLDMARIELAFIEYLLDRLTNLRYDLSANAWQQVQVIESAYELVWAALTTPLQGDAMRTFASHTYAEVMYEIVASFKDKPVLRKNVVVEFLRHWPEIREVFGLSGEDLEYGDALTQFLQLEAVEKLTSDFQELKFIGTLEEDIVKGVKNYEP